MLSEAKGLTISVYDPTFFIAFEPAKDKPARISEGAPKGCEAKRGRRREARRQRRARSVADAARRLWPSVARTIAVECSGP